MCCVKLLIHSPTSTVQLQLGNGSIIVLHILLGMLLHIHAVCIVIRKGLPMYIILIVISQTSPHIKAWVNLLRQISLTAVEKRTSISITLQKCAWL